VNDTGDRERRERVHQGVTALIDLGAQKTSVADRAGISRPTLDAFLVDPQRSSSETVDALYDWLMARAQRAAPERRAIAGWLRFLARMLEADRDVAELVFPAGRPAEGAGGDPPSGAVPYPPDPGAEEAS